MNQKQKRTGRNVQVANRRKMLAALTVVLLIIVLGLVIVIKKYTPTNERMDLKDFYKLDGENQAAVVLNGTYEEVTELDEKDFAKYEGEEAYLEINFLKNKLDDGYVYDAAENILRYTTDANVITVNLGNDAYYIDKQKESFDKPIVISEDDTVYVAMDFIKLYTDINYYVKTSPNRIIIETAGYEKTAAVVKKDTKLRRFGGVKSKILADAKKGDKVAVIENYGKWSLVLSDDGVLGCIENKRLKDKEKVTVASNLQKREYQHITLDEKINMAWHQVTTKSANGSIAEVLSKTKGINVLSPTWFYLNDNNGNIADVASLDYVNYCHTNGIQVWGLVSNLENTDVDTTSVLNTTSSRDNLVNNLIAAAITYNLDGINIDIEQLRGAAADGYIEFIKELSLKCEKNGIILSVDNYAPSASSMIYNRTIQADYADYVVIMAYDEHYAGSDEAGSVASLPFVEQAIKDTLTEVPANQVILGMPFYTRVWIADDNGITSQAMGMDGISKLISDNQASVSWSDEDGQNYAEYTKGDKTYMIWIEDASSLEEKLKLMESNKLAGGSFWKLGFDNTAIWNTIGKYMN